MTLDESTRVLLVAILKDHRDCLEREDFPICGKAALQTIKELGLETELSAPELDSKAPLIWQLDGLIEVLEDQASEPGHQLGCVCADCSGAELSSDND